MKLVYQIPNKLYYIQNFLDYPTYKKLHYEFLMPASRFQNFMKVPVSGTW
jgi:hypothetical protein